MMQRAHHEDVRDRLRVEADAVRAHLLATVGQLEERRHELTNVKRQVRTHSAGLTSIGAILAMAAMGAVVTAVELRRMRARNRGKLRIRALRTLWQHPERFSDPKLPILTEIGRRVALGLATFVVTQIGRRAVTRALPAKSGELAGSEGVFVARATAIDVK